MIHSKVVTTRKGKKGMTTYYIRGATIWLNYYVDGKRIQKSTKLKNTSKNLNVVKNQMIPALDIKIATGEIYKKKPKTFEYYGSIFLKLKSFNRSYILKKEYYERVIKYFGNKDIDTITRLDVKQYLLSLEIKSSSKNVYKSTIKEIFELAVDEGILLNNPALHIKSKVDERKAIEYYTKEEVNKLLNVATGVFRVYLMIAFNTGLRSGEILGLQLGDFEDKFISIKRTRTKGVIGHGKNWNSKRKVPYPSFIFDEVKKIQTNSIFVFNKIDDSGKWQHHWKRCVELAKVKKIRMYCTRHTFATLMLKDNIVSINELAGILGHSSVKTTLDKYASVINANTIDLGYNFSLYCDTTVTVKNNISK